MNFELKTLPPSDAAGHACDLLVVFLPEDIELSAKSAKQNKLLALAARAREAGDWQAKIGQMLMLYEPPDVRARKALLLGCGNGSAHAVCKAVVAAAAAIKGPAVKHLTLLFATAPQTGAVSAAIAAVAQTSYIYTTTKTDGKGKGKAAGRTLEQVTIGVADAAAHTETECATAAALALGVEYAREWANRPANHATPTLLGQAAKALAKHAGIRCKVHDPDEVAKLGMGAFEAVGRGSKEPLRLIELHYEGGSKAQAPIVLVGKGITFDTGGISLKPSAEMDEMKFDMGGAASVLGVFRTLAQLRPAINVIGLIPACENMPDGKAVKPGDVVTSMSGQSIEILNTDAEGRLVLCDALTYAARFQPAAMIDIATLTGACVISLGAVRSGLFATDDALAAQLQAAGDVALDLCWRMPLDDEYAEGLKSHFADVANVAGRAAGSVTAAKFLQRFVEPGTPWAHLDIAGVAWKGGAAKGATGRPVGLLVHYLLSQAAQAASVSAEKAEKTAKVTKSPKAQKATRPSVKPAKSAPQSSSQ